jgi:cell wall-associated NlpC family hydrolase
VHKKLLCAVVALGITLSMSARTFADPSLDDQLNSAQANYKQGQSMLNSAQKKASDLQAQIESLDSEIQNGMAQVDSLNGKISNAEADINVSQEKIKRSEENIKIEQSNYNETIRAMYISGNNGYVSTLLESKGISDFISRVDNIKTVANYNDRVISDLNSRKQEVQKKKDALEGERQKLVAFKSEQNKKLHSLNKQKAIQAPLIAQANDEVNSAQQLSASANAQISAINKKVQDMKAAQQAAQAAASASRSVASVSVNRGGTPPPVTGGYSSDAIVTYAAKFQGVNYVWGGTSPSGFDCSGFVQYVYAHFGISIPRVSEDQFNFGTPVDASNLQPGDLVFFNNKGNGPGHVGMYIGGGLMIHAPRTGDVVKIVPLSSHGSYCGARRVK